MPSLPSTLLVIACVLLPLWPVGVCQAAESQPAVASGAQVILDQQCYWRSYVRFGDDRVSPASIDTEGETTCGVKHMEKLRSRVEGWLKAAKPDSPKAWTEYVSLGGVYGGAVYSPSLQPFPPANWMLPDFDDQDWILRRQPVRVGIPGVSNEWGQSGENLGVESVFLRTRFELPDPGSAGRLALGLTFRGGIRAFINGTEVARGGLPDGALTAQTPGLDYPKEAYLTPEDEQPPAGGHRSRFCSEVLGKYADDGAKNVPEFRRGLNGRQLVCRKTWERIQALRDRKLGPVAIPPGVLRKGINVLAIEIRPSLLHVLTTPDLGPYGSWNSAHDGGVWSHGQILEMALTATGPAGPSAMTRPDGVQVWVADPHERMYVQDFCPPGEKARSIRLVGPRNGGYAAQLAVGTSRELAGLKVAPGPLNAVDGKGVIGPECARVLFGVPLPASTTGRLSWYRSAVGSGALEEVRLVRRHAGKALEGLPPAKALEAIKFFDQLSPAAPPKVPADSCQTIWLSWKLPADAAPGKYRGLVKVLAIPAGAEATSIPVELEVIDWRVPDPTHLQTYVGMEQSPYGIAKQYGIPLWSDQHFKYIEASFRELARTGNRWIFIPCIQKTEFGNLNDVMIKWIRRRDGSLAFDYGVLDRYIGLASKFGQAPDIIDFVVMVGFRDVKTWPPTVPVLDEASGKTELLHLAGAGTTEDQSRKNWRAFAVSLYEHMKGLPNGEKTPLGTPSKGLDRNMYWGYPEDAEGNPPLKALLAEFVPQVDWTFGSHVLGKDPKVYRAFTTIYDSAPRGAGWKNPMLYLRNPRGVEVVASTYLYRSLCEWPVCISRRGPGRIGADYWAGTYLNPPPPEIVAGLGILATLWPGADGPETSARYEALIEGLQETEARIFLEQAVDRKLVEADLAKRIVGLLENRYKLLPPQESFLPRTDCYLGWQEASRLLYQTAAQAGQVVGLDVDKTEIVTEIAPKGGGQVTLQLRNWTSKPRPWKAVSNEKWLVLDKTEGSAIGIQDLPIRIDAAALDAEKPSVGTIVVTDAASGRDQSVKVTVNLRK